MTGVADYYGEGRQRMLELAATIDDAEANTPVVPCPGWTVKDVYAHLAGVTADVLAGTLTSMPTDEWTAGQVAARADLSLAEVCAEWADRGPRFDNALRGFGDKAPAQPAMDVWTHEQDVRGALARPGSRDLPVVAWIVGSMLGFFARSWATRALPPITVAGGSGEWTLGDGEPVATLSASDFELARTLIGHRSRAQFLGLGWDQAPPDEVVEALHAFPLAEQDVIE